MDKEKILDNLAQIQLMFEKAIRLNSVSDIEVYSRESELMIETVALIFGEDAVQEFPKIASRLRKEIRKRDKSRIQKG